MIVSPFLACADENGFKERITEWVKQGGTWTVRNYASHKNDFPLSYVPLGNHRKRRELARRIVARGYLAACKPRAHRRSERERDPHRTHGKGERYYRRGDRKQERISGIGREIYLYIKRIKRLFYSLL